MKNLIKDALVLFAITLIAGLCLGFIYEITKEPRAIQQELTKQKAYKAVFSDASTFEPVSMDSEGMLAYLEEKGVTDNIAIVNEVVSAVDKTGTSLGVVVTVTSKEGYSGDIVLSVGIQNDGTISGISLLSIAETAGLGMKAKEDSFKNQFANKNVDSFVYTKSGATEDNEIDAISGATITTNAMTNSVNAAIYCFDFIIGGDSVE